MRTRKPSDWLTQPRHFGNRPDVAFLDADTLDERADRRASELQHWAALAASDELDRRGLSAAWLASQLGENAEHLRRKLRGHARASLRDLAAWNEVLGIGARTAVPA